MTFAYYRNFLRALRAIVKCGICGHKQKIQFHHIKPTELDGDGRGMDRRARDIIKHPDCYIPLCYFCHQKVTQEFIVIFQPTKALMWWYDYITDKSGTIRVI